MRQGKREAESGKEKGSVQRQAAFSPPSFYPSIPPPILDYLGCSKKNTINWVLINNRNLFLMVLEIDKSGIKGLADLMYL